MTQNEFKHLKGGELVYNTFDRKYYEVSHIDVAREYIVGIFGDNTSKTFGYKDCTKVNIAEIAGNLNDPQKIFAKYKTLEDSKIDWSRRAHELQIAIIKTATDKGISQFEIEQKVEYLLNYQASKLENNPFE